MTQFIFNENEISLGSIGNDEDRNVMSGISINTYPVDIGCQVCGRSLDELQPFGKAGDPLVGDFDGRLLVKRHRPEGPYDEKAIKAFDEAKKHCGDKDPEEWMIEKYGREEGHRLSISAMAYDQSGSSRECRDCIVLDDDEYFDKLRECGNTFDPDDYIAIPQHELNPPETLFEEAKNRNKKWLL